MPPRQPPVMEIRHIPIEILWRALDLMGCARHPTISQCLAAYHLAEDREQIRDHHVDAFSPLAKALAEFVSSSGAFHPETGSMPGGGSFSIKSPEG